MNNYSLSIRRLVCWVSLCLCALGISAQTYGLTLMVDGSMNVSACVDEPIVLNASATNSAASDAMDVYRSLNGTSWHPIGTATRDGAGVYTYVDDMMSQTLYYQFVDQKNSAIESNVVTVNVSTDCPGICHTTTTGEYYLGTDFNPEDGCSVNQIDFSNNNCLQNHFEANGISFQGCSGGHVQKGWQTTDRDAAAGVVGSNYYYVFHGTACNNTPFVLTFDSGRYLNKSFRFTMRLYLDLTNCSSFDNQAKMNFRTGLSTPVDLCMDAEFYDGKSGEHLKDYAFCANSQHLDQDFVLGGDVWRMKQQGHNIIRMEFVFYGLFKTQNQEKLTIYPEFQQWNNCAEIAVDYISGEAADVCMDHGAVCIGKSATINAAGFPRNAIYIWESWNDQANRWEPLRVGGFVQEGKDKQSISIPVDFLGKRKFRVRSDDNHPLDKPIEFYVTGKDCDSLQPTSIQLPTNLCVPNEREEGMFSVFPLDANTNVHYTWKFISPSGEVFGSDKVSFSGGELIEDQRGGQVNLVLNENAEEGEYTVVVQAVQYRVGSDGAIYPLEVGDPITDHFRVNRTLQFDCSSLHSVRVTANTYKPKYRGYECLSYATKDDVVSDSGMVVYSGSLKEAFANGEIRMIDSSEVKDNCSEDIIVEVAIEGPDETGEIVKKNISSMADLEKHKFGIGMTTITYTFIDGRGNETSCEQAVVVSSGTTPLPDCPVSSLLEVQADENCEYLFQLNKADIPTASILVNQEAVWFNFRYDVIAGFHSDEQCEVVANFFPDNLMGLNGMHQALVVGDSIDLSMDYLCDQITNNWDAFKSPASKENKWKYWSSATVKDESIISENNSRTTVVNYTGYPFEIILRDADGKTLKTVQNPYTAEDVAASRVIFLRWYGSGAGATAHECSDDLKYACGNTPVKVKNNFDDVALSQTLTKGEYTLTYRFQNEKDGEQIDSCMVNIHVNCPEPLPLVECPADTVIHLLASCEESVQIVSPVVNKEAVRKVMYQFDGGLKFTYSQPFEVTLNQGNTELRWYVQDTLGNEVTCQRNYVVKDSVGIMIVCPEQPDVVINVSNPMAWQDIFTQLDVSQKAFANKFDCQEGMQVAITPRMYYKEDLSAIWNELSDETVLDYNRLYDIKWLFVKSGEYMAMRDSCFSSVFLKDTVAPEVVCGDWNNSATFYADGACVVSADSVIWFKKPTLDDLNVKDNGIVDSTTITISWNRKHGIVDNTSASALTDPLELGTTTMTWIVTDASGNSSQCQQTITVVDTTGPVFDFSTLKDIYVKIDAECQAPAESVQKAGLVVPVAPDDACSPTGDLISAVGSRSDSLELFDDLYPIGTTRVTWTFEDALGNKTIGYQNVIVTGPALKIECFPEAEKHVTLEPGKEEETILFEFPQHSVGCGQSVTYSIRIEFKPEEGVDTISKEVADQSATFDLPAGIGQVIYQLMDGDGNEADCYESIVVHSSRQYDFSAISPSGQELYYKIIGEEEVALVTPYVTGYASKTLPEGEVVIPDNVSHEGQTYNITKIEEAVFQANNAITSIVIPKYVMSISGNAFAQCDSLKKVTWNAVNYAEGKGAASLLSASVVVFEIGKGVKSIPPYLCYGMKNLSTVLFSETLEEIGAYAFYATSMKEIIFPQSLKKIGSHAFDSCSVIRKVTCYSVYPPEADKSTFYNYNGYLYMPCDYYDEYDVHECWGLFKHIECLQAEETEVTDVEVEPHRVDVGISWPVHTIAFSYSLKIYYGTKVVCELRFNSDGQLVNIDFGMSVGSGANMGKKPAPAMANDMAMMTSLRSFKAAPANSGYKFTVTGLSEGTTYQYTLDVLDKDEEVIDSYVGTFVTEGKSSEEGQDPPVVTEEIVTLAEGDLVYQYGNHIVCRNEKQLTVQIYNMLSQCLYMGDGPCDFQVPYAGLYVVRIGDRSYKFLVQGN